MGLMHERSNPISRKPLPLLIAAGLVLMPVLYFFNMASSLPPDPESEFDRVHRNFVKVDMHSHTTESDGDRTAEEQLQLAGSQKLEHLWISDHDMIRDLDRTRELQGAARAAGVAVSFGVEITVDWLKKEHHLLGYFPDSAWAQPQLSPEMVTLQAACAKVKSSREIRNNKMVAFLNEVLFNTDNVVYFSDPAQQAAFQPVEVQTVADWARDNANLLEPSSLGRPHFSKYLSTVVGVRKDLIFGPRDGDGVATVTSSGDVFWDADREGKTGSTVKALMHSATLAERDIAFKPLPILEAIALINAAGGRAVVAHIPTLGTVWETKFGPNLADLKTGGLWGIEAFSSEIDSDNHSKIVALAIANGLQVTGGSDNHGTLKPYAHLGDVHRFGTEPYDSLKDWAVGGTETSTKLLRGGLRR